MQIFDEPGLSCCIIFTIVYWWSWGQIIETKQCCHFGTLEHLENWVLVSKSEKGIVKMIFLKPFTKCFRNLESLFGYSPNLLDCVLPQQETLMTYQSPFLLKISKIHASLNSSGNQLSRVNSIISKFGIEMPDMCGHTTRRFRMTFNTNLGTKKFLKGSKCPFWNLFDLVKCHLSLINVYVTYM